MGFIFQGISAQYTQLEPVVNDYIAIESIIAYERNDVDSVLVVGSPNAFDVGDTVMVYVVKGSGVKLDSTLTDPPEGPGIPFISGYSGKYAFLIIDEITGSTVVFNTSFNPADPQIREIGPLAEGEEAQLIRVPSYRRAEVSSQGVTAPAWDPVSGTGGVVAMFVTTTLKLSGDIDVTGKGFKGAVADQNYNGDCSSSDPEAFDSAFYNVNSSPVRAGRKGEGISRSNFELMRGWSRNINGGGGGNGLFSGGGGGSNFSTGGNGGNESDLCPGGVAVTGGAGGYPFNSSGFYVNLEATTPKILNRWNRIFFGGGGGTGTRMPGKTTSDGGDGGGLVIIIADTIDGSGGRIIADGESVTASATGAAGGGGAGGGIILDVSGYKNNLQLSAIGGRGGNTNDSNFTGPGGGGGGGIYWLGGSNEPGVDPELVTKGANGTHFGDSYGSTGGDFAGRKNALEAPLKGFLFNSVPSAFWVCSDQEPEVIFASEPKGGDGSGYSYLWVDSSSTQNFWQAASGTNDEQHYDFEGRKLTDTTYFRRIVNSGLLQPDTSFRIAVYVHQAITNNLVSSDDEICQGNAPQPFVPIGVPADGDGTYDFKWVFHEGNGVFADAPGSNNLPGYSAPDLQTTSHYSRIVNSGACADTSIALVATVLPPLAGFDITPLADTICKNTAPSQLSGGIPTGGKDGDKRFLWESSLTGSGGWSSAGETLKDYQPGTLSETTWYRRMAYSGTGVAGDACVDSSNAVEVLIIEPVSANTIVTAEQTVCKGVKPLVLQGSNPGGGYLGAYSYRWQSMTLSSGWVDANDDNPTDEKNYQPVEVTGDTTWYRRVVGSGGASLDVCTDASDPVAVNVLPSITNNVVMSDDVKCQFDLLGDLVQNPAGGSEPGGGASQDGNDPTRNYKWEVATGQAAPASGWSELSYGFDKKDYSDNPRLTDIDDYWYRRIVFSGPGLSGQEQVCSDTSDLIHITIHTAITDNEVDAADSACFNSDEELQGKLPLGEPGIQAVYLWRDNLTGSALPGSDSQDYTHLFNEAGPYQFSREVIMGECEDTSNTMVITVMELPGGELSADLNQACEKDTLFDISLNIDALTNYITPWAIYLDDGVNTELDGPYFVNESGQIQVNLETHNNAPSTVYNYRPGRIVYTSVTGSFECEAPAQNMTGEIPIEVFNKPQPKISVGGMEADLDSICGNSIQLLVDPDYGTGSWSHDPSMYMSYDPDPTAFEVSAAIPESKEAWDVEKYLVSFKSEAGDCAGSATIALHFFEPPAPAFAGNDTFIYVANSLKMNADPATAGMGTWLPPITGSGNIIDPNDPNTLITGLEKNGQNSFRWLVTNGNCQSSSSISIVTHREMWRPEGISPNGDGLNDVFIIRGLRNKTGGEEGEKISFTVTFFNNLGKTVREVTDENWMENIYDESMITGGLADNEVVAWDARAKSGNLVPAGTYYYVVSFEIEQRDGSKDRDSYKDYIVVRD